MADISKLEQQANLLFDNVAGWESSTLQRIGKRIGKYSKMSIIDSNFRVYKVKDHSQLVIGEKIDFLSVIDVADHSTEKQWRLLQN